MFPLFDKFNQMTSSTNMDQLPSISPKELKILSATPGTLKVIVKEINGYFLPIIHHLQPNGHTQLLGIIVDNENVLATVELADIVTALEEVLGVEQCILTPETPSDTTMH